MQAQEPKTRAVPSGTLLASLDLAIKFADELTESTTWRASYRCSMPSLLRDTVGTYQRHLAMTPADANLGWQYFMNHE